MNVTSTIEPNMPEYQFLKDEQISIYVKASALLISHEYSSSKICQIRLPHSWLDADPFLYDNFLLSVQSIDPECFNFKFNKISEMVLDRIHKHKVSQICILDFKNIPARQQLEFYQCFFQLQMIPLNLQMLKNNLSISIPDYNSKCVGLMQEHIKQYVFRLFELNQMPFEQISEFLDSYLLIRVFNPQHYLILRQQHLRKSYAQVVQAINETRLKTFNKNLFILEIIGSTIGLWNSYLSQSNSYHLKLLYQVDLTQLNTDKGFYNFSSKIAMFIELARLEFTSWRCNN